MRVVEITSEDLINWNAVDVTEKKANQIINILKTRKGEIPFMRGVGISDEFIDRPINEIKPALVNDVTAVINDNIEGVNLLNVEILNGESIGDFKIRVVCVIE